MNYIEKISGLVIFWSILFRFLVQLDFEKKRKKNKKLLVNIPVIDN